MSALFISYRRQDCGPFAAALNKGLCARFGAKGVVFDLSSTPPGVDFREYLTRRIRDCDVVLAVIGPSWRDAQKEGQRRLEQVDDPVLVELEVALQSNKHVIPLLVNHAEMPVEKDLPNSLKTLAYRNAIRFTEGAGFDVDMKRLFGAIRDYRRPKRIIRRLVWTLTGFVLAFILLSAAVIVLWIANRRANSESGAKANLARLDGEVFTSRGRDPIHVARAFPDRDSLDKAGSIKDQILAAQQSFDLFMFSGKTIAESENALIDAAERGVRIRIVMIDHNSSNEKNVAAYLSMIENAGRAPEWYRANYQSTLGIMQRVRDSLSHNPETRGRLEVRTYAGAFSNSFWVRDAGLSSQQAAQIAVTLYGDDRKFPSVRFGELSAAVLSNLTDHFNYVWSRSHEVFSEEPSGNSAE